MNISQDNYRLLLSVVDNDVLVMCYYPSDVKIIFREVCEILDELGIPYRARKNDNSISIKFNNGEEHKIRFVPRNNERAALGFRGVIFDEF